MSPNFSCGVLKRSFTPKSISRSIQPLTGRIGVPVEQSVGQRVEPHVPVHPISLVATQRPRSLAPIEGRGRDFQESQHVFTVDFEPLCQTRDYTCGHLAGLNSLSFRGNFELSPVKLISSWKIRSAFDERILPFFKTTMILRLGPHKVVSVR
jgi:hypothetical protein